MGPALGGLMIAHVSVGWAYAVNAVSFLFVIAALMMMKGQGRTHIDGADARDRGNFTRRGRARRAALRLPRAAHPIDDAAGFFRDVLFVGDRAAADLRAGHPARRRARLRLAVRGAGGGRGADERGDGARGGRDRPPRAACSLARCVVYGLATVVFGLSTSFWLTFACLALTGAADTVSMVFRNLIRQLETPDHLRGRMTGVNMVFFMGGPQLGELEAGLVANWLGAVVSVVSGGIGCMLATVWIAGAHARAAALPGDRRPAIERLRCRRQADVAAPGRQPPAAPQP